MERAPVKLAPETALYPPFADALPQGEIREGRYLARFARTREELDAILRLRFEVFNLELGEGLTSSFQTGRDMDEFDLFCHHLIVEDTTENRIIGTYRCQTSEMASSGRGFYSGVEFDMSSLSADVLSDSIELGRACITPSHRNTQALFLLWKGLAMYVAHNRKRYLFGCCSLTSQNEREGWKVMRMLEEGGHLHPTFNAGPQPGFECQAGEAGDEVQVTIPKLFRTYLRFGARVCGPPAIDRLFKTIDYLVLFDVAEMDAQTRKVFFGA
ncbi:MAG: GNAT family N-acyltransferase [Acidobacteriota bacterium]